MEYVQKYNNGICTCDMEAENDGTTNDARVFWKIPVPLERDGRKPVSWDPAPIVRATAELFKADDLGVQERVMRQYFDNYNPTPYTFSLVLKEFVVQMEYGQAFKFRYICSVTFAYIEWDDGTREEDVEMDVEDFYVYRQREDTESWLSDDRDVLFIPWQDER